MSVQSSEREFHDELAATLSSEGLAMREPDDLEVALLDRLPNIDGRRVLDLGCGAGELSWQLAARGAKVTALDISPGMVALARKRLALAAPEAELQFVVAPAEQTGLEAESFDLVVGKWILHHVDVEAAAAEIARVLRPGGTGVFIENSSANILLSFAREKLAGRFGLPRYGTEDEHPLGDSEYAALAARFSHVALFFPDFCFFQLFDRQVFRHRSRRITQSMRTLDSVIWHRAPGLRRYSYHVIVELSQGARLGCDLR